MTWHFYVITFLFPPHHPTILTLFLTYNRKYYQNNFQHGTDGQTLPQSSLKAKGSDL